MEKPSSPARAAYYTRSLMMLAFLFAIGFAGTAQTKWAVGKSSVTFKIKNAGITVDGALDSLSANIAFDADNYAQGSIEASVRTNTINTDNHMRDNHLRKPEYFDVAAFPAIKMKSTSFAHTAGDKYTGHFNLTIKGVTKDVVVPFIYTQSGSSAAFKGSFTINRRDYNVGSGSLILGDELTVDIELVVSKQ